MTAFKKNLIIMVIAGVLFIITVLIILNIGKTTQENDTSYRLQSYENTVALYKDEKIIKIYEDVVLDTLPISDRSRLSSGIQLTTPEEAEEIIEDYDG